MGADLVQVRGKKRERERELLGVGGRRLARSGSATLRSARSGSNWTLIEPRPVRGSRAPAKPARRAQSSGGGASRPLVLGAAMSQ